jgi:SAM-dependent methyltransferase
MSEKDPSGSETAGRPEESDFDPVAADYRHRLPYLPQFFAQIAASFALSKATAVLDLGCGTGELSVGLAPYCGPILGLDQSEAMIAQRDLPPNVRLRVADVNAGLPRLERPVDLVVIGRAIHFFAREPFLALLESATTDRATVLICGSIISPTTPWRNAYIELLRRYGRPEWSPDDFGRTRFAGSAWSAGRMVITRGIRHTSADELFAHALSYSSMAKEILHDRANFERQLKDLLAPYRGPAGDAELTIASWCMEYKRAS